MLQSPSTILWQCDSIDTDACALLYVLVCSIMNLILSSNLISRYYCCWYSLWLRGKRTSRRHTTVYALAERKAYRTNHPTTSPPARPICLISCNNACIAAPKTNHYFRVHISPQSCHTFELNSSHYWTCSPRSEQAQYVCFGFGNPPQHRRQRKSYIGCIRHTFCIDVLYTAVKQRPRSSHTSRFRCAAHTRCRRKHSIIGILVHTRGIWKVNIQAWSLCAARLYECEMDELYSFHSTQDVSFTRNNILLI